MPWGGFTGILGKGGQTVGGAPREMTMSFSSTCHRVMVSSVGPITGGGGALGT